MSEYDEHLLASAPAATREQKQALYNVDLLKNSESNASAQDEPRNAPLAPSTHDHEAEAGLGHKEHRDLDSYAARPAPWYRTKKWIVIFVILGVVVVAAVVGGAVGGTVGHKSNNNSNNNASSAPPAPSGNSGTAPDSGGAGAGDPDSSNGGNNPVVGSTPSPTPSTPGGIDIGDADFVMPTGVPVAVGGLSGAS